MTLSEEVLCVRAAFGPSLRHVSFGTDEIKVRFFVKTGCALAIATITQERYHLRVRRHELWLEVKRHFKDKWHVSGQFAPFVGVPGQTTCFCWGGNPRDGISILEHPSLPVFLRALWCLGHDVSDFRSVDLFAMTAHEEMEWAKAYRDRLAALQAGKLDES
jgi:hypothetical protein